MLENDKINELIKRWQDNRDEKAITELYRGLLVYRKHLMTRGWCTGVGLDAESLLDDAFLKSIDGFDPTKSTFVKRFGWIFRQLVVGYKRDSWYARHMIPVEPTDKQYVNHKQEYILTDIERGILQEAIEKLNGDEAIALRLLMDGHTFGEIREKMGFSNGGMNYLITRAKRNLKEIYA